MNEISKNESKKIMEISPVESKRFNKRIYRGIVENIEEEKILSIILAENIDIAILRIDSEKIDQVIKLDKLKIPYLVADTLVYYQLSKNTYFPKELRNKDLTFVECKPEHESLLKHIIRESFVDYKNHYTSNPLLNPKDILEGYEEWACSYISAYNDRRICFLVKNEDELVGFATCSFDEKLKEAEGVLYGVMPSASGRGIYGDIIRFTQTYFKNKGYESMKVSTQIQNFAVQKVWGREGFFMRKSVNTIHINSLMNCSAIPKKNFQIKISKEDVLNFGKFDEIFDKQITPEMIINIIISKYLLTICPIKGSKFFGYQYKFLKPIELNRTYNLSISFPIIDKIKGFCKSLVKVFDEDNNICVYSYHDFTYREN